MPIKEFLALTVIILSGIFAAHPLDFRDEVRKVELSILREISRTDTWGNPSFSGAKKYISRPNTRMGDVRVSRRATSFLK